MLKLVLVFAAALALGVDCQSMSYLALCKDHTMVIYPAVGKACAQVISSGVSEADIDTIVDLHNALRRRVALGNERLGAPGPQFPAANMRMMKWDTELATLAQRWASQCISGMDSCRKVDRFNVAQNVYRTKSSVVEDSTAPWNASIYSWYNEVSRFNKKDANGFKLTHRGTTTSYTKLVWADTYLVGCGYAYFKNDRSNYYWKSIVCNYGPGGNILNGGYSVYVVGNTCSKCPSGTTCIDSLCA